VIRPLRGEVRIPLITRGSLISLSTIPIAAFVGYNGSGKSLMAAVAAMTHAEAGRTVLGTARLLDWRNPRPCADVLCESARHGDDGHMAAHPNWRPLNDFRQLFQFSDGHVWLDEATGVADARGSQSLPGEVSDYLPRLRAQQVTLHWTTIHWSFADVRLRRITWSATFCSGMFPKHASNEVWQRNRAFLVRTWDARNLSDDFDPAVVRSDDPKRPKTLSRSILYGPRSDAFGYYDTLDPVLTLAGTDESGMCLECGGHRGRKRCKGHDDAGAPQRQATRPGATVGALAPTAPPDA
jgi:hypothetical protein